MTVLRKKDRNKNPISDPNYDEVPLDPNNLNKDKLNISRPMSTEISDPHILQQSHEINGPEIGSKTDPNQISANIPPNYNKSTIKNTYRMSKVGKTLTRVFSRTKSENESRHMISDQRNISKDHDKSHPHGISNSNSVGSSIHNSVPQANTHSNHLTNQGSEIRERGGRDSLPDNLREGSQNLNRKGNLNLNLEPNHGNNFLEEQHHFSKENKDFMNFSFEEKNKSPMATVGNLFSFKLGLDKHNFDSNKERKEGNLGLG